MYQYTNKKMKKITIYGKQTVKTVVEKGLRKIIKIIVNSDSKKQEFNNSYHKKIFISDNRKIDNLIEKKVNHQGYVAEIYYEEEIVNKEPQYIVVLDKINDQGNIGSIIRTCAAFGIDQLILSKKFFSDLPSIFKSASGGTENINIKTVTNINNEIIKLKNYYIYGLDSKSNNNLHSFEFNHSDRLVFIFGSESEGISDNVLKKCNDTIKIPIQNINSLNVATSVAAFLSVFNYSKFKSLR
jgi:tRNA G18 (ribose-2'-O)-methylase SpoU